MINLKPETKRVFVIVNILESSMRLPYPKNVQMAITLSEAMTDEDVEVMFEAKTPQEIGRLLERVMKKAMAL